MQNGGEGLPSIILAGRGILVKMLITLDVLIKVCILIHYRDTAMKNDDTALPRFFCGKFF